MGDALYKNLEGMSQSRGLPGGYTTARSGRVGSSSRESGLSGTLSRLASGRGGRNRQAVYQPITPMMDTKYSGKAGGIAGVGFGLKAVANVMQAIENYKAAQDMLTIAQEDRDAAKEQAARELMEKSRAPLIALAQTMNEMPEEERAAFGEELMEGGAAQGLDPSSMNLLKLTMKSSLNLPSEAESAKLNAQATAEGTGLGEKAAFKAGGEELLKSKTDITNAPITERTKMIIEKQKEEGSLNRESQETIAGVRTAEREEEREEKKREKSESRYEKALTRAEKEFDKKTELGTITTQSQLEGFNNRYEELGVVAVIDKDGEPWIVENDNDIDGVELPEGEWERARLQLRKAQEAKRKKYGFVDAKELETQPKKNKMDDPMGLFK